MKILLSEQQFSLIIEASKTEILVNKIGFSEDDAQELEKLTGNLSVWLGKKIQQKLFSVIKSRSNNLNTPEQTKQEVSNFMKGGRVVNFYRNEINSIMDWFRTGLNGNIKPYENLSFDELGQESDRWHESLNIGDNKIDYVEKNPVIIDFRNKEEGLYWVNLGKRNCPEEAERMGHCASSSGYLFSLREYRKIPNNHTLNKSHLTASITSSGELIQLKGPKNSKPSEEYNKYILPLFYFKDDGDYLIQSIGSEYEGSKDFQLVDLPDQEIIKLYKKRPDLFKGRKGKRALKKVGLMDDSEIQTIFDLNISPKDVKYYVDGDFTVRTYTDKQGRKYNVGIFETLLGGDIWDLYGGGYENWKESLNYYVDKDNVKIIQDLILPLTKPEDVEDMSLEDILEEYDVNHEITGAIANATSTAESDSYYEYVSGVLKNTLRDYGEVIKMNDEGVTLRIDLKNIINETGVLEDELDEFYEKCNDDLQCVFGELLGDYFDKPEFQLDDRWYPTIDEKNFNSILRDYLNDIVL
jgi:hypothetical protein